MIFVANGPAVLAIMVELPVLIVFDTEDDLMAD
jgi:hypothetical protein